MSSIALLRPCGKLMYIFTKMSRNCRSRIIEKLIFQSGFQGYVHPIHNATYCCDNREEKKWSTHNNNETHDNSDNNSNNKDDVERRNKTESDFPPSLRECLEKLNVGFYDMKVNRDNLHEAVRMYAETPLDNDQIGIFLLKCCGGVMPDLKQEVRRELADLVWKILEKKTPEMSLIHYHTYLDICAQNCTKIDPEKFIKCLKIPPDECTYRCLLKVAARNGNSEGVKFILMKMKELNYSANHETFSALIEFSARKNDMKSINSLFESFTTSGDAKLDEFTGELAKGYATNNDIENVLKLLKSHPIEDQQLLIIMRTLSLCGNGKDIEKLFEFLSQRPNIIFDPLLHNIIIELVHSNRLNDALLMINFFASNYSVAKTILLVLHFLKATVSAKIPNEIVLNIGRTLYERYSMIKILHSLLEESLRSSHRSLSLLLLEEMRVKNLEIRPHYYWPLLKFSSTIEGETGVLKILHHMEQMHVPVDHQTLLYYVLPFLNTLYPRNALTQLKQHNIPISVIFESLVCYLLRNGQISQTLSLFNMMKGARMGSDELSSSLVRAYEITKDVHGCVEVLKFKRKDQNYAAKFLLELVDNKSLRNDIVSVFKKFINAYARNEIYISSRDAEFISERLLLNCGGSTEILESLSFSPIVETNNVQERNATRFSVIPHPQDMDEQQLENHLIELQSKRMNTRGVLRKLFMLHCKKNNLVRVEQLLRLLKKSNIPLTFGMKAVLLELYAHNGRTDELKDIWLDLRQNHSNSTIDASKILYVALAFVKRDEVELALKIIEENGKSNFATERGCWKLLDAITASTSAQLVDSALKLLVENGYCKISTTSLGPLVRRHLLQNDISSAVNVFKSVALKYGKTPLRRELVITLIEKSDNHSSANEDVQTMLQDVLKLISNIHGNIAVHQDLIVSYARCGLMEKLRAALKNPKSLELSIDDITVGMPDEIKIRVLKLILEASTEVTISLRHSTYESLLLTYYNMEKYQDAIDLKRKMDAEGIITSTVVNKVLSDLLLRHKIQIPSDLKLCSELINNRVDDH